MLSPLAANIERERCTAEIRVKLNQKKCNHRTIIVPIDIMLMIFPSVPKVPEWFLWMKIKIAIEKCVPLVRERVCGLEERSLANGVIYRLYVMVLPPSSAPDS